MATVQHLRADEEASKITEVLNKDGCVVLDNVLSTSELDHLQQDLERQFNAIPDCQGDFYGYSTKRLGTLFTRSEIFQKMAILPNILGVMDDFLLKGCSHYQINLTQAISIGPKEIKQIMHQDDPMFPFLHPGQEAMINCMWAVDDFTEENGATVLVPGSHLWPRTQALNLSYENLPPHLLTQGVMSQGSVLIYLGSLYHCGGANRTTSRRTGAVISYSLGWLRQAENHYLAYTRDELLKMPEILQKLLGYFVHQPNLGSINGIDPYNYLIKGEKEKVFMEFVPEIVKPLLKEYRETYGERPAN
ncbi:MAG: phytanoyl-CoA dioxygenase family protein [Alphaproteobacteria bacterium]|nr:phytanoyl-CoA dioxygenase family protein [Alphaproteobacteria bacterium]